MIVKMEKLILYALSDDKKKILERLMGLQCVQMIAPEQLVEYETLSASANRDMPQTYELENKLSELSAALGVLAEYEPKAKLFSKKAAISFEEMLDLRSIDDALKKASSVRGILTNIAEVKSFQSAEQFTKQSLLPWQTFDLALDALSTHETCMLFFTLPTETDIDAVRAEADAIACQIETIHADADQRYIAVAALKSHRDAVIAFFKEKNGLPVVFSNMRFTPAQNIAGIDKRAEQYEKNLTVLMDSLAAQAADIHPLKAAYDRLSTAIAQQKAKQNLLLTENAFLVGGWIPVSERARVETALNEFTCFYEYKLPGKEEDPPVKFKNNSLIEPFECITEMYGFPAPSSIDPNPLIAPFFFLFFGMMLSDAGYGLLLLIAGFVISRKVEKGSMMYKMTRMIGLCGISTILWGAIYGGWFGDVITQFSKTFLNMDVTVPLLINPLEEPMTILVISLVFGVVHIFVGMGAQAYLFIRRGHFWDAICDVGFWYLVLGGLGIMLGGAVSAGGTQGLLFQIGTWAAILGAAGLLLTGGRNSPTLFGKITGGLGSLYGITGYFSDILSYSRILALGLATGVIAMVINILATMAGGGFLGAILFTLVFIFGHALNLAINALGSYVHTSRLQYVEFFGKYYEGGGKPFMPFKANTKYQIIQTREEN